MLQFFIPCPPLVDMVTEQLYKAEDIARALEYNNSGQDRRRQLAYFRNEYLVWSCITADVYRILEVFSGKGRGRSSSAGRRVHSA